MTSCPDTVLPRAKPGHLDSLVRLAAFMLFAPLLLLLVNCGGGGGNGNSQTVTLITVAPGDNRLPIIVNAGLLNIPNRLYASVTLCNASGSNCTPAIDNVLVDTGSVGLRLLSSSAITALGLPAQTVAGQPLMNCARFLDNTNAWGTVKLAKVTLGGLTTSVAIPIQVIADPTTPAIPASCGQASSSMTSATGGSSALGANGILGLGLYGQDCGGNCASSSGAGYYYTCLGGVCNPALVPLSSQVQHPVPHFSGDNNGLSVALPSVPASGGNNVQGWVYFGVNTRSNNQLNGNTILYPSSGDVQTSVSSSTPHAFGPVSFPGSFFDTGSNGLYFGTSGTGAGQINIPIDGNNVFYVPPSAVTVSATVSDNFGNSKPFSFIVADASQVYAFAQPTRAGKLSNTQFDWGLPFFFGRTVFQGIEGLSATTTNGTITGPYYGL